jgi:hypothetical protein
MRNSRFSREFEPPVALFFWNRGHAIPDDDPRHEAREARKRRFPAHRFELRDGHLSDVGVIFRRSFHRIVRPIRHAHLLENELLEEIVCFLPPHAVGVANMEAMALMSDSGTTRVTSAGSHPKYSRSSVPKEIESSRLWYIQ